MKSSTNPITGDNLVSKVGNQEKYSEGYDKIWGKKEEPKSYSKPIILVHKVQCKKCNDIIESKHRHDFVTCSCGSISIDGGKDYMRWLGNFEDFIDLSEVTSEDEDDWFERVRETFTWNSYGKDGKGPKKEILLKNLEEEHIEAILETQWHIQGTSTEEYLKKEMDYRNAL